MRNTLSSIIVLKKHIWLTSKNPLVFILYRVGESILLFCANFDLNSRSRKVDASLTQDLTQGLTQAFFESVLLKLFAAHCVPLYATVDYCVLQLYTTVYYCVLR